VLKEIGSKWSKVSEQELSALKKVRRPRHPARSDGLEKARAQRDMDALLKGRHNLTLIANG
jgi:hypothetical protein